MADHDLRLFADQVLTDLLLAHPLRRPVRIEWRSYRVTAGMAYYKANVIGLSRHVLTTVEAVGDTLIHEYAHLLAYERSGRRGTGHGTAWRAAMAELGRPAKVRHSYEVKRNSKHQEVGYQCLRCGQTLIRTRRLPGRRRYVHVECGGDLKLAFVRARLPEAITEPASVS